MLGDASETKETVLDTLNTMGSIASKWDLVFVSTGIRVYNGSPIAEEITKMLRYLHKRAIGELTYEEFGQKFLMTESRSTQIMYMGYAVK
jgi:hypothetical protein